MTYEQKVTVILWGSFENVAVRPLILNTNNLEVLNLFWAHFEQHTDKRNVLGCLQLLSVEKQCCWRLLEDIDKGKDWLQLLLSFYGPLTHDEGTRNAFLHEQRQRKKEKEMILRFQIVQILANIFLTLEKDKDSFTSPQFELVKVCHKDNLSDCYRAIQHFNQTYPATTISAKEGQTTSWQSLKPFAHLLQADDEEIVVLGALSMAQLMYRKINRDLMESEGLLPLLICVRWSASPRIRSLGEEVWNQIKHHVKEPPSLLSICLWNLRRRGQLGHDVFSEHFDLYVL